MLKEGTVIIVIIVIMTYAVLCGVTRSKLPGEIAQIEQLRKDSAQVSIHESEDVIGQITQWNQEIISNQTYNKIWWADWVIPDDWESVEPIKIPSR
jgi:hypothetical protein